MAIVTGQTTRALRGMGSFPGAADFASVDLKSCHIAKLDWSATDNDTVTPGSGGVPYGVVALAWVPDADNEACSIYWDASTQTGTFAEGTGPSTGYLIVFYRPTRT